MHLKTFLISLTVLTVAFYIESPAHAAKLGYGHPPQEPPANPYAPPQDPPANPYAPPQDPPSHHHHHKKHHPIASPPQCCPALTDRMADLEDRVDDQKDKIDDLQDDKRQAHHYKTYVLSRARVDFQTFQEMIADYIGGAPGDDGAQGDQGEDGAEGAEGEKGATGAQGDKGQDSIGATGLTGRDGEPGEEGPQGDKGQPGSTNAATGQTGPSGTAEKGDQGIDGIQGPIGPVGPKGETGPPGTPGHDLSPGSCTNFACGGCLLPTVEGPGEVFGDDIKDDRYVLTGDKVSVQCEEGYCLTTGDNDEPCGTTPSSGMFRCRSNNVFSPAADDLVCKPISGA